jgi:iron complex transport system permease protein
VSVATETAGAYARVRDAGRRRATVVAAVIAVLLVAVAVLELILGGYPMTIGQMLQALTGQATRVQEYIVLQVRMPHLIVALGCGAAFALSGALLQTLLRNPLASPDLLGISGGASVGAVWATLIVGASGLLVSVSAFAGALVVAVVLLLLGRRLSDGGYRLVLAGVGIAFLCTAVIGYLLKRAQVQQAQDALQWITGSIGAVDWSDVVTVVVMLVVAGAALLFAGRSLPVLELGDATASGLGVRVGASRVAIVVIAVLPAAAAASLIGPVGFVALCAPAIARAIIGRGHAALGTSMALGALLLCAADLVAQFAIPGTPVAVGVVTGAIGAPYLLWTLAKGRRA